MNGAVGLNVLRTAFGTHANRVGRSHQQTAAGSLARCLSILRPSSAQTRPRRRLPPHPISCCSEPQGLPSSRLGVRTLNLKSLGIGGYQVPKHYIQVHPKYKDELGVPFMKVDLDEKQVESIFGQAMSVKRGNQLLRILHGRRVAGTLQDPTLKKNLRQFTKAQQDKALKWLRKTVPVDEVIMAGLRAEDELAAIEKKKSGVEEKKKKADGEPETIGDAVQNYLTARFKMYKDQEMGMEVYGVSVLDEMIARNKAIKAARLKELEAERKKREEEEAKLGPLAKIGKDQPRALSPRMKKWVAAATSDLTEPPSMAMWERILPSFVLTLLVLGACFAYAEFYQPPTPSQRLFRDLPPSVATIGALITINLMFFVMWKLPPLWWLLNRYAVIVVATPKPLSLLGAMFSHQKGLHLLSNVAGLAFIGSQLHDEVGRGNFLAVYMGTGMIAGLCTLTESVLFGQLRKTILGMSSAWYGVMAAYFWIHRFDGFKVFGLPPDPYSGVQGTAVIALVLALNIAGLTSASTRLKVDLIGHIAGMCAGVLGGAWLERKKRDGALQPAAEWGDWQAFGLFGFWLHQLYENEEKAKGKDKRGEEDDHDDNKGLEPGVQQK